MLKENMSIKDIEALTQEEMEVLKAEGKAELAGACTIIIPVLFIAVWVIFGY